MAVRFDIKTLVAAALIFGSCAEEGEPQRPSDEVGDTDEDESPSTGKRDAGSDDEDDDSADDDSADDDSADDDSADDDAPADDDSADDDAPADDDSADDDAPADDDSAGDDDVDEDAGAGDKCADLTYAKFGKAFIENYCASCHSGSKPVGGMTLSSLDDVEMYKDEIVARVVDEADMPPKTTKKQPTAAERTKVGDWIECGAK